MNLNPLSPPDLEQARLWRNAQLELLRTPYPLTKEQQEQFYREVVCSRQANARYWGVWQGSAENMLGGRQHSLIGMAGLENIQWENRLGEISLLFNPVNVVDINVFDEALTLLLYEGFMRLNLENIFSEVYFCNPFLTMWGTVTNKLVRKPFPVLPSRKYWQGKYYDSFYLNFAKGDFLSHENPVP